MVKRIAVFVIVLLVVIFFTVPWMEWFANDVLGLGIDRLWAMFGGIAIILTIALVGVAKIGK